MKRGKPYVKKFSRVSDFDVWIVDGNFVRDNIDEEFTNFGQHFQFKFIPKKEFWIDRERNPGEEKYFIDAMLVMNRLMLKGISRKKSAEFADRVERRERRKSDLVKKELKRKKLGKVIYDIHKRLLKKYSSEKLNVWIVDGELVRDLFFTDFTEGGHDKVYNFVPKNEIWIDDDLSFREIKFVLLHEIHERNLMAKGMKYNNAHKSASEIEYFCRKHSGRVDKELKKEFKKVK